MSHDDEPEDGRRRWVPTHKVVPESATILGPEAEPHSGQILRNESNTCGYPKRIKS
jgi:hypothetical protein